MRVVIYARYSSDSQSAASIEDQLRLCKEFIARQGWSLQQVFRDIVATYIATHAPEQADDIALVLVHSTQKTSERHYNHAGRLRATDRLQAVVEAKRRGARHTRKDPD